MSQNIKFKGRDKKPERDQLCVCRCPNWCEEGYVVAMWDGGQFYYAAQPNDNFDSSVIAWYAINDDGLPL